MSLFDQHKDHGHYRPDVVRITPDIPLYTAKNILNLFASSLYLLSLDSSLIISVAFNTYENNILINDRYRLTHS